MSLTAASSHTLASASAPPVPGPSTAFQEEVLRGLSGTPKTLPCCYFYDLEGSLLFERICDLPEYYLTRTEDALLAAHAGEIAEAVWERGQAFDLVEYGSGSSRKTRRLLEAFLQRQSGLRYLPIDISREMLHQTAWSLSRDYPRLTVEPVVGEYGAATEKLPALRQRPTLFLFLGSNLGNFTEEGAAAFLRRLRGVMQPEDRALLGLDMWKDPAVLHAAYNDSQGVTAAFNLNLLRRINAELGGDVPLSAFRHEARVNGDACRVEMHLVSLREQTVRVAGQAFRFAQGESIHTENSCKYTPELVERLASGSGLRRERVWMDERGWFTVNLLAPV